MYIVLNKATKFLHINKLCLFNATRGLCHFNIFNIWKMEIFSKQEHSCFPCKFRAPLRAPLHAAPLHAARRAPRAASRDRRDVRINVIELMNTCD